MSNTLECILSLKDKFSAVSEKFNSAMNAATKATDKVNATTSKVVGSMPN